MLTVKEIQHAIPGNYIDGNGLYLQVSKAGTKSWIYRYQIKGKRREMGLGSLDLVSPVKARAEAGKLKALVKDGVDPIERRRQGQAEAAVVQAEQDVLAQKATHTFAAVARKYIDSKSSEWTNSKHAQQWENTLATYAFPVIGKVPVAEISRDQVLQILKPIWTTKTETGTRVRSRIELVLDFAKAHGWRTGENPAVWRGNLKAILPNPTKLKNVRHHPALPWKKMPQFMADLRKRKGIGARALEFAILTAARTGEVRGATWREFDLDAQIWIVPAKRMKMKREHRIPLPTDATALLKDLPRIEDKDLVFPGVRSGQPLSDMSLAEVIRGMNEVKGGPRWVDDAGENVVPHGFRSTFRDWAAEVTNYPSEMAEKALAHAITNATEAAYRREDMVEKRRQMMKDWAAWCRPAKGKKVVSVRTKASAA